MATKKQPKIAPRPKPVGKTRTPKQLAIQWGAADPTSEAKRIRRHLRRIYATTHEDWALTDAMVKAVAEEMGVDPVSGKKVS